MLRSIRHAAMMAVALCGTAVARATMPDAPPVVTSPAPDRIALTVYRADLDPDDRTMDLDDLGGFGLVTETRTIRLPAGKAVLRFEGVVGGIVSVSAIITGLPGGTIEKNRDGRLLSPASLVDGTLGRQVTLRRTDRKSGKVQEDRATIVAGPGARGDQGIVLRTARGIETLGCSGLGEAVRYDGLPDGLSAKPVLSVTTDSPQEATATVTLSYLADGFDWRASYVATVEDDERSLNLFAWLTLANGNAEALPDAEVQAVAGKLERQRLEEIDAASATLQLRCYPLGTTTSDLDRPAPAPAPMMEGQTEMYDIVVTASRRLSAPPAPAPPPPPEDLGDLKLYRVPERVTVAANGQKQVALLVRPHVQFERFHHIALSPWDSDEIVPAAIMLRLVNTEKQGLGVPLPTGTTSLYGERDGQRLLLGLGTIDDVAKNERTRLSAGISRQVNAQQTGDGRRRHIVASNANPFPVKVEIAIGEASDGTIMRPSTRLDRIDGIQTWRITLPANGTRTLDYQVPES